MMSSEVPPQLKSRHIEHCAEHYRHYSNNTQENSAYKVQS